MDSGVETGNESNDSLVTQLDYFITKTAAGSSVQTQSDTKEATEVTDVPDSLTNGNSAVDISPNINGIYLNKKILTLAVLRKSPNMLNTNLSSDHDSNDTKTAAGTSGQTQPDFKGVTEVMNLQDSLTPVTMASNVLALALIRKNPNMLNTNLSSDHSRLFSLPLFSDMTKIAEYKRANRQSCDKWKGEIKNKFPYSRFTPYPELRVRMTEIHMRRAASMNDIERVTRLLEMGVTPNNSDQRGRTPLHYAASRGYTEMVHLLLKYGANPNMRDCIGSTPLHLAVITHKIPVVTLLLNAGTDVLSSDSNGHTPLQLAQSQLRLMQKLQNPHIDMNILRDELRNIVAMLLAYLRKQQNIINSVPEQVESLSNICSRLSLSNTSDQIQDDIKDLLDNINSLSLTK